MLKILDQQTLEASKDILNKTLGTEAGDLIRWKTRRFFKTVTEEYNLKLAELATTAGTAITHLHIDDAKVKSSRRVTKR